MRSGGIGASVSSWISENLLEELDHEVIRLSSQDVPTAYAKLLEDGALRTHGPRLLPRYANTCHASCSYHCAGEGRPRGDQEDLRLNSSHNWSTRGGFYTHCQFNYGGTIAVRACLL